MIKTCHKYFIFKVHGYWFDYTFVLRDILSLTCYWHIKNDQRIPLGIKKIFYTVEISLCLSSAEIFLRFPKKIRTAIRKAESEGIISYFHQDISEFVEFFNSFAFKKGIFLIKRIPRSLLRGGCLYYI